MTTQGFGLPEKPFQMQKPMLRVCYALTPLMLASIYFFGWRSLLLLMVVAVFGIATEAAFTFQQKKPVTSAVFVSCLIFHLSLPPATPFWMAAVGIIFGVAIGKMVFGGFGQNVFNPAMVGRCFLYVTFPVQMTNWWSSPGTGLVKGLSSWSMPIDAVTMATPLKTLRDGDAVSWLHLFFGNTSGSLGETSALLILLGGGWLVYKKAANWRLAGSYLLGGVLVSSILSLAGVHHAAGPVSAILSGAFLFGAAFIVTEPISAPNTKEAQVIYGFGTGALIVVLRAYSNFSEGVMFSILLFNALSPIMDQTVKQIQTARKAARESRA